MHWLPNPFNNTVDDTLSSSPFVEGETDSGTPTHAHAGEEAFWFPYVSSTSAQGDLERAAPGIKWSETRVLSFPSPMRLSFWWTSNIIGQVEKLLSQIHRLRRLMKIAWCSCRFLFSGTSCIVNSVPARTAAPSEGMGQHSGHGSYWRRRKRTHDQGNSQLRLL